MRLSRYVPPRPLMLAAVSATNERVIRSSTTFITAWMPIERSSDMHCTWRTLSRSTTVMVRYLPGRSVPPRMLAIVARITSSRWARIHRPCHVLPRLPRSW
jgi:hypothetical protein